MIQTTTTNPHPLTIGLDYFALLATFAAALAVIWVILGVWHWLTYRSFCKREDAAAARLQVWIDKRPRHSSGITCPTSLPGQDSYRIFTRCPSCNGPSLAQGGPCWGCKLSLATTGRYLPGFPLVPHLQGQGPISGPG